MEADYLFLATAVELEELDECLDFHKLRIQIQPDMVKDGKVEVTQPQFQYL
jgi:hypothetical protein